MAGIPLSHIQNTFRHVAEEEQKFWDMDGMNSIVVDPIIIPIGGDSDSDEETEQQESEYDSDVDVI
jgi:hypothetical protein